MESFEQKLIDLDEVKKEELEKKEIPLLRKELEKVKEKTRELREKEKKPGFFHGAEILDVNINELSDDDVLLYKDLKNFLRKKIPFDEMFKELSLHRLSIGQHIMNIIEKNPDIDYRKDSRVAHSAWVTGRAMDEYGKRVMEEKKKKGA
jgi:hypothetical protein